MRRTNHAAVVTGPGHAAIQEQSLAPLAPHQVRLRLEGCGVCGSNLPVWEGRPWFNYPLEPGAPGHEGWGTVDEVGGEVSGFRPGDRVAALTYHAFAEYDVADADRVVKLPAELAGQPFPGEALGCAINVFKRSGITAGQTVAIVGVGFMGALLTSLASKAGARVVAITRREFARETARQMGAADTLAMDDHGRVIGAVKELTDGRFCDCVIEATGLQWPLDLAGEITTERGRLIIAGYHQDGPRQVNMQLWNWRGLDVINAHERESRVYIDGMREAAQAVAEGRLDPTPLYTHHYRLGDFAKAMESLRGREGSFLKALVLHG